MNILIIEDEILIQQSLKKLLEKKGATVDVTSNGIEGIEYIKTNDYDRVITDLMLNDITGFDIIEEAKSRYTLEQLKDLFVIITAYSSEQVLEKAKEYGCIVLNKPFESMPKALEIFMNKAGMNEE